MVQFNLRRRIQHRISTLRRCIRRLLDRILACSGLKTRRYRMLRRSKASSPQPPPPPGVDTVKDDMQVGNEDCDDHDYVDCDNLVALKICLLGDRQVGKTSFLVKYVGKDIERKGWLCPKKGLKWTDKTLFVRGARISHCIWEVEGDENFRGDNIPVACKDSVAILFMFDLTSRISLNNVIYWYQKARKRNLTAIPIIVGTKFDEFIQLPTDMQWTIASQARAYARVLNATLFFSSATYSINVNKIFKFITAKLFDLPWTLERNLTIGEPIIDF